ncbi:hypothetical protein BpHYR1_047377 [Brachionus plicatilis]|uniref:Uncharacterized protein n=1 Tax=Brachionus plicatilis TaxID=10195 RepID=A0A3M7QU69_BRAPC|nr:hypothetical protein BpHYR1_047377 [Brachionus plicatilis]
MEGIMMKRIIGVNKRTHTTVQRLILYALDVEPVDLKIKKIKTKFARRLLENGYTHELLQSIENNERDKNKFKNKFLNEMKEILKNQEKLEIEKIKRVIKETEEEKKIMAKNGISDSIKTCFAMINSNDQNGKTLLNLLIKAF